MGNSGKLTHDVSLGTDSRKTVNVFADGNQDLSGHVTTLLRSWGLVLNVNTSSTLLDEELGQLHHSSQTTMSSIRIGNDGAEVVDVGQLGSLRFGDAQALLSLLSVVEQLRHEEVADLVGDGGLERSHVSGVLGFPSNWER